MFILLYGPDTYRSLQKLNEIIEHYKRIHKNQLNLQILNAEELSFEDFKNELQQFSIFPTRKIFVIKNIFTNQEFKKNFHEYFKKLLEKLDFKYTIIFYEEGTLPKDSFFEFLKKNGKSQEFELLTGQNLKNWVKRHLFDKYQVSIDDKKIKKLIEFIGNDLWRFSNEIQKLINYSENKNIKTKDIDLLVKPKIETDIFKTIEYIASKNRTKALELLHKHLEKGDSPLYLLTMINYQFRNLLMVKDLIERKFPYYLIVQKIKLHPFVVKKTYEQANKFSFQELKEIYQKIFKTDLDIKTGAVEPETALYMLITE